MRSRRLFGAVLALALVLGAASRSEALPIVVDIDAQTNDLTFGAGLNPSLLLGPGTYTVTPIAGTFTAWNNHCLGVDFPCDPDTRGFAGVGWMNTFSLDTVLGNLQTGPGPVTFTSGLTYTTPGAALADAAAGTFTLLAPDTVYFGFLDSPMSDNLGGMSLQIEAANVTPVPEPATVLMLTSGLAGLAWRRRRLAS